MAINLATRSDVRPSPLLDWHSLTGSRAAPPEVTSFERRVRWCGGLFTLLVALIFARVIHLEQTEGAAFRAEARRPLERQVLLPASRGRILARDGTILAHDVRLNTLEVHYRYLELPRNPAWLRRQSRLRLTRAQRNDPQQLSAAQEQLEQEIDALHAQLASWSGLTLARYQLRCRRIQQQVEAIHRQVNQARIARWESEVRADQTAIDPSWPWHRRWRESLVRSFTTAGPPPRPREIAVAEEVGYHATAWDIAPEVVRQIEQHPKRYPGVRIGEQVRRLYPQRSAAAHLVGHLGNRGSEATSTEASPSHSASKVDPSQPVGLMGMERACERELRGQPGELLEYTDPRGRVLDTVRQRAPRAGGDINLTIDLALQQTAEQLLDNALLRRAPAAEVETSGGALVVLDVHTGDVLAAASAPRFDPSLFVDGSPEQGDVSSALASLLANPQQPLFDRTIRMALPPGSVMKVITAAAALTCPEVRDTLNGTGSDILTADERLVCQGYLYDPESLRCAIFRRNRSSHGEIDLADALALSCNVYFFRAAQRCTASRLAQMGARFGLGRATGIELPGEATGNLPGPQAAGPASLHLAARQPPWQHGDLYQLAIGQGAVTATPMQMARVMAALANGGRLVRPRVRLHGGSQRIGDPAEESSQSPERPEFLDLDSTTLAAIRRGLVRTAHEPHGTAFEALGSSPVRLAVKTGTAQAGAHRREHAWLAGFAPAEAPRVAVVVILEHAGDAAEAAGPVFNRVVQQIHTLGYFGSRVSRVQSAETP